MDERNRDATRLTSKHVEQSSQHHLHPPERDRGDEVGDVEMSCEDGEEIGEEGKTHGRSENSREADDGEDEWEMGKKRLEDGCQKK